MRLTAEPIELIQESPPPFNSTTIFSMPQLKSYLCEEDICLRKILLQAQKLPTKIRLSSLPPSLA